MAYNTRSTTELSCPLVGDLKKIDQNTLPTRLDVLKHFLYIKEYSNVPNRDLVNVICKELSPVISNVWSKASLPCVSDKSIHRQLETLYRSYKNLKKNYSTKKDSQSKSFDDKSQMFIDESKQLFVTARISTPVLVRVNGKFR